MFKLAYSLTIADS